MITDIEVHPITGDIWYTDFAGYLRKFVYVLSGNRNFPPIVRASADRYYFNSNLEDNLVQFSSDGTYDVEG